jgi:hypothetical protein
MKRLRFTKCDNVNDDFGQRIGSLQPYFGAVQPSSEAEKTLKRVFLAAFFVSQAGISPGAGKPFAHGACPSGTPHVPVSCVSPIPSSRWSRFA